MIERPAERSTGLAKEERLFEHHWNTFTFQVQRRVREDLSRTKEKARLAAEQLWERGLLEWAERRVHLCCCIASQRWQEEPGH